MIIETNDNKIIIKNIEDFNLEQTLECGQVFRYNKIKDHHYIVNAVDKVLEISQENSDLIFYNITQDEFDGFWRNYFDLDRDYKEIKEYLIDKDPKMKEIIDYGYGIRILNQDFFETLISFIISQNKQIPHIRQIITTLSSRYGEEKNKTFTFPSIERLSKVSEEEFRECKTGFRAKYLVDACDKFYRGIISEDKLTAISTEEVLKELCTIKGVGVKVSNCVLLFGLGRKEAFPIDVWIKRIMEEIYFQEETKLEIIQKFAEDKFGTYGGFAQQYLFYYSRRDKMKK